MPKKNYKCRGQLPKNAKWASPYEETDLVQDTILTGVIANTLNKCEYVCKPGFTLNNGACVKQESYHWECSEKGSCVSKKEKFFCKSAFSDPTNPNQASDCDRLSTENECNKHVAGSSPSNNCIWTLDEDYCTSPL